MTIGNLVRYLPQYAKDMHYSQWEGTGLVISMHTGISIGTGVEVLWDNGYTTFCSMEDLELIEI